MRYISSIIVLAVLLISCSEKPPSANAGLEKAIVVVNRAILRSDPHPVAPELDAIDKGFPLAILKKTEKKHRVAGKLDYWYYVRTESGIEGWTYGASLSIGKEIDRSEQEIHNLQEKLIGKWWDIRNDGSTGYFKIYFWPDGKYKHGFGNQKMEEGTYIIRSSDNIIELKEGSRVGKWLKIQSYAGDISLSADFEGKVTVFRRGDPDPDATEISPEEEEKKAKAESTENESKKEEEKQDSVKDEKRN